MRFWDTSALVATCVDEPFSAAALAWAENRPSGHEFVCLDHRLREAAQKEGFVVVPGEIKASLELDGSV